MATSEARIAANRANSLHSTGPKTAEGKAASRRNALKHGMTGNGVVIPGEDQFLVVQRFEDLAAKFAPEDDPFALLLAQKSAMLWVRTERCYRFDVATTADRVRKAGAAFDEARRAEADWLLHNVGMKNQTHVRQLQAMPEGIDLLLEEFRKFRRLLLNEYGEQWTPHHALYIDMYMGHPPKSVPHSRVEMLQQAIQGNFAELQPDDGAGLESPARMVWAKAALAQLIADEIARLEALRGSLDHEAIALGRAEAGERALIDTGAETIQARKYEAATERALFHAIHELKQIHKARERDLKAALKSSAAPVSPPPPLLDPIPSPKRAERDRTLASFFPDAFPTQTGTEYVAVSASVPRPPSPSTPRDRKKRPKLKR